MRRFSPQFPKFLQRTKRPDHETAIPIQFTARPRTIITAVLLFCLAAEVSFLVFDYVINYARGIDAPSIRRLFNITREDGIASLFAILQTFMVAAALWAVWALSKLSGAKTVISAGWLILALFFSYMTIDDGALVHERLGSTLEQSQQITSVLSAFPSYEWQILFIPVLVTIGVFMLIFLMKQFKTRNQKIALVLALGCLSLAVILDFFEGLDPGHNLNIYAHLSTALNFDVYTMRTFGQSEYATLIHFSKAIEETLEMFAITLLWTAFLSYLMMTYSQLKITFKPEA